MEFSQGALATTTKDAVIRSWLDSAWEKAQLSSESLTNVSKICFDAQ